MLGGPDPGPFGAAPKQVAAARVVVAAAAVKVAELAVASPPLPAARGPPMVVVPSPIHPKETGKRQAATTQIPEIPEASTAGDLPLVFEVPPAPLEEPLLLGEEGELLDRYDRYSMCNLHN